MFGKVIHPIITSSSLKIYGARCWLRSMPPLATTGPAFWRALTADRVSSAFLIPFSYGASTYLHGCITNDQLKFSNRSAVQPFSSSLRINIEPRNSLFKGGSTAVDINLFSFHGWCSLLVPVGRLVGPTKVYQLCTTSQVEPHPFLWTSSNSSANWGSLLISISH